MSEQTQSDQVASETVELDPSTTGTQEPVAEPEQPENA